MNNTNFIEDEAIYQLHLWETVYFPSFYRVTELLVRGFLSTNTVHTNVNIYGDKLNWYIFVTMKYWIFLPVLHDIDTDKTHSRGVFGKPSARRLD